MMDILNSMGGARASNPRFDDRPVKKVAPKGIAGERGGKPVALKKSSSLRHVDSSMSFPVVSNHSQRMRDKNPRAAPHKPATQRDTKSLTTRSDYGPWERKEEKGSVLFRTPNQTSKSLEKKLLETIMAKNENDISRLPAFSESHISEVPPLNQSNAWTTKFDNSSQSDLSNLDSARALAIKTQKPVKTGAAKLTKSRPMHELPNKETDESDLDEALPTIADLTAPENVKVLKDEDRNVEKMKYMDLFHQLILWKKTNFLLDNISFTQDFCDALVEEGLFNADMMREIMDQRYDVERTLKMLSLLGTWGNDCYDGFLRVLQNCKQTGVVKELRKTERFTKYGEQLPAVYHYFLNLSDFLRKYQHIATKLGEDEKEILNKFIEGHIEMGIRKNEEKVIKMTEKIAVLKAQIRELKNEIRVRTRHEHELEDALARVNRKIDELYKQLKEQQDISLENRNEARKLRHFRAQQEQLVKFIVAKSEELEMPDLGPRQLSRQLSEMKNSLDKQKSQIDRMLLERAGTKEQIGTDKKSSAGNQGTSGLGPRRHSKLGSRQNSKISRGNTMLKRINPDKILTDLRINQTQLNILANKVYYMVVALQTFEAEERRITQILENGDPSKDKTYRTEMRKALSEIRQERKSLAEQLTEQEKLLYVKEGFVKNVRQDVLGVVTTPEDVTFYKTQHDSLVSQMQKVLDHLKVQHDKGLDQAEEKRLQTIKEFEEKIQDIKNKNVEEQGKLRLKIRTKIAEINEREKILNRLKKQITTMANYASKNMNAQVTVDECRKITRSMIGEARKLKAIAEEKDREKAELERLEAIGDEDTIKAFQEAKLKKEEKKQKALDKRKRKKKQDYLADDRLRYVGDRLCLEWRVLGKCLGLTNNRMDMVEWDCPLSAKQDQICFAMLKAWRDEERGKIIELVEALRQMGRNDLAIIVLPLNRMHLLEKKKKKGEESEEDEDDEDDDEELGELPALPPGNETGPVGQQSANLRPI